MTALIDTRSWYIEWGVRKYDEDDVVRLASLLGREPQGVDFTAAGVRPYEANRLERNLLTTAGVARIHGLVTAVGGLQAASATATRIGVGNGAGTAAVGDTDLSAAAGSANRQFVVMDASFPTAGAAMTFQSSFTSTLGNFAWNEFGIDIGTPTVANGTTVNALLLNHKTSIAQGTKTSGQTWVATATVTIA